MSTPNGNGTVDLTDALALADEPALLPCRHCGEPVAVRTRTGRLRALGEFTTAKDGRLVIVCPACGRDTRLSGRLVVGTDRT